MEPAVARTELYSYLVTRHTGRTVRTNIERQLAEFDCSVLAVLDLTHVELIDFSCADEIVAKLVLPLEPVSAHRRFLLLRGLDEHHVEPIDASLTRQGLAAAAERIDGEPLVVGTLEEEIVRAWREIWALGTAEIGAVARRLRVSRRTAGGLLDELDARALIIRQGNRCVSFGRVVRNAPEPPP